MARAQIRIDQPANVIAIGVVGRSRDDINLSQLVQLRNGDDSGVRSWRWKILHKPPSSGATLSSPISAAPSFTPDVVGTYRIRLTVNDGLTGEVDVRTVAIRDSLGLRVPAANEAGESNWPISGEINDKGWQPEFDRIQTVIQGLDTRLTAAESGLAAREPTMVVDIDFTQQPSATVSDGDVEIDDVTWTARNIASRTTDAEMIDDFGLQITHATGSTSLIAGADTAPRLEVEIESLIPDYNPNYRYAFFVQYSWSTEPDEAGERFSIGIWADSAYPVASAGMRFAGATATYSAGLGGVSHEGERTNVLSDARLAETAVLGFKLEGPTEISVWQATSLPIELDASVQPILSQRAANINNAGDYNIFNPRGVFFTMALAASGATATHSVVIERLQIWEVP